MCEGDELSLLPFSLASVTLYPFSTSYNSMVDMKQAYKTLLFETAIGVFSGGYFMNK